MKLINGIGWLLGMDATNLERTIIAVCSLIGVTFLGIYKIIDSNGIIAVYSTVIGYVLGHGAGKTGEQLKQSNK